jgi:hypothetical protein
MAVHIQGGLGVSAEAAATAYLVRARAGRWPAATPRPAPNGSPTSSPTANQPAKQPRRQRVWTFHVELSDDDQAFLHEVRDFLGSQVTEDVIRHDRETGDNFHEGVHLALGARASWRRSGSPPPTAGSPGFGAVSGNWRSAAPTCRG